MLSQLRPAIVLLGLLSALTGLVYPLAVTGVAHVAFADSAAGSLIVRDGRVVGSDLVGQAFIDPGYFWGRPSATGPYPCNAAAGAGSNQGPTNPALHAAVADRVKALREADPGHDAPVPVDLVTVSGSGLDPHISPAAAFYQVGRVARVRGLSSGRVRQLVDSLVEPPTFGVLGSARVNVLRLNLALDAASQRKAGAGGS